MDDLERLIAIEEIKRLKARYFRCVDTRNWEELATLFAPDIAFNRAWAGVVLDQLTGGWKPSQPKDEIVHGREAVTAMVRRAMGSIRSVHHGHMPEIEVRDAQFATGMWAMEDILRWSANSTYPNQSAHGYGHYFETYEKLDGQWRIKSMKLRRLRVDLGTTS